MSNKHKTRAHKVSRILKPMRAANDCPCGSGMAFIECHGAKPPSALVPMVAASAIIDIAPAPITLKLDLACGQSCREGFEGVDVFPDAKHIVNLQRYPWPFEDNSVDELHCSHYIEHVPSWMVQPDGTPDFSGGGQDALLRFFDECYRILRPDGWFTVIAPAATSTRAFQDPTHRRYIPSEFYAYLNADWRKAQKLDHYVARCHFIGGGVPTVMQEFNALHAEVQARKIQTEWNCVFDWVAKLQAKKA